MEKTQMPGGYKKLASEPQYTNKQDLEKAEVSARILSGAYGTFLSDEKSDDKLHFMSNETFTRGPAANIFLSLLASLIVVGTFSLCAFVIVTLFLG